MPVETGLTGTGIIVGTSQYMSPEQIEGKPADSRSDVFAFGCLWFEMLTGKKAFVGETAASLMAAILRGDPPELPADFSPALCHALTQCWAKNPDERWQADKTLMAVSMRTPEHAAVPTPLFKTAAVGFFYGTRNAYAPSRDGQHFLVNTQTAPGAQFIDVIVGWQKSTAQA